MVCYRIGVITISATVAMLSKQNDRDRMLSQYTVLDLSIGTEIIGARILGDLGANVISIEPPSGSPVRLSLIHI